jgi:hypothetical protein
MALALLGDLLQGLVGFGRAIQQGQEEIAVAVGERRIGSPPI